MRLTTNWKTQDGWREEIEIDESDWLDEQTGREFLSKCFFYVHCYVFCQKQQH